MARKYLAAAGAAALVLGLGLGLSASASTLKCVAQESCGGADLAFTGHGALSLAALATNSVNGGFGYNDEHVGFTSSNASDGSQDFTVFQDSSEPTGKGGIYGFGDYVAMYTPGGKLPFDLTKGTKNPDGSVTVDASAETAVPYCVSVEDTYPKVGGKAVQRWALVLRNCFAWHGTKFIIGGKSLTGTPTPDPSSTASPAPLVTPAAAEVPDKVYRPDLYQVWGPTEVPGPFLEFQDVALNNVRFRHGFSAGRNFVMDDRGWGGSGTWGIAYPDQQQLNQKFTIIGCTEPVTVFNDAYFNCPS